MGEIGEETRTVLYRYDGIFMRKGWIFCPKVVRSRGEADMDRLDRFGSTATPKSLRICDLLNELVGACGFEPQTPTVQFIRLPDQLTDQFGGTEE